MKIQIFFSTSIVCFSLLSAMVQEAPKLPALTYFDVIPRDVTDSWVHEWQRQCYGPGTEIPTDEAIRIRDCVKVDSPHLAPIFYFLYKKDPHQARALFNGLLTLAVEVARQFEPPKALRYLLKIEGIDPNVVDTNYRYACKEHGPTLYPAITPLLLAASENKPHCVKLLVQARADVNESLNGQSPLGNATSANAIESAWILLNESTLMVKDKQYLHACYIRGFESPEIAQLLLEKDSTLIHEKNDQHQTALFHAVYQTNNIKYLQPFLPYLDKIDINQKDALGQTLLHCASRTGNIEFVKILLNLSDLDVNAQSDAGFTALHSAVYRNRLELVQLLLNHPAIDVLEKTTDGKTAYDIAADCNDYPLQHILQNAMLKKIHETNDF